MRAEEKRRGRGKKQQVQLEGRKVQLYAAFLAALQFFNYSHYHFGPTHSSLRPWVARFASFLERARWYLCRAAG